MSWFEVLAKRNEEKIKDRKVKTPEEKEKEEQELLNKYYEEYKTKLYEDDDSGKGKSAIPRFYFKLPTDDDVLQQKLREESRAVFLQRKSRELLDNEELHALWNLLEQHSVPPPVGEEQMINYDGFLKVKEKAGEKCSQFFKPLTYAKLYQKDVQGRISIMQFFNYVMRKVWLYQTRIGLSLYDVAGQGFLRESDLENYILELIPTLPQLDGLEKSFYSFYVCTAVRKFFFFLDPMRTGKIKIQDILSCSFLDDLLELRDEILPKDKQESNWFSAPSALRVYGQYLNLDTDHNGMLSKEELKRYGTGTLTSVFLDRVFQECLTYEGEMDYKTYLDFVLALENKKEPQATQYLFKILDVQHNGFLNTFAINYFFRAIQQEMEKHGHEVVLLHDVKDEIFDMVKPVDPIRITVQDLINSYWHVWMAWAGIIYYGKHLLPNRSNIQADKGVNLCDKCAARCVRLNTFGSVANLQRAPTETNEACAIARVRILVEQVILSQADTIINILVDVNGFLTYENRELLVLEDNDDVI